MLEDARLLWRLKRGDKDALRLIQHTLADAHKAKDVLPIRVDNEAPLEAIEALGREVLPYFRAA